VVLVGAIIVAGQAHSLVVQAIAFFAVVLGGLNVFGGFVVTDRMLGMFHSRPGGQR
jgi:NAD(P) transhydrogenase subunit alpha